MFAGYIQQEMSKIIHPVYFEYDIHTKTLKKICLFPLQENREQGICSTMNLSHEVHTIFFGLACLLCRIVQRKCKIVCNTYSDFHNEHYYDVSFSSKHLYQMKSQHSQL